MDILFGGQPSTLLQDPIIPKERLDLWSKNASSEGPPQTVLSSLEFHVPGLVCSRPLPRTIEKAPRQERWPVSF